MIRSLHNSLITLHSAWYALINVVVLLAFPVLFVLGDAKESPFLYTGILLIGCGIGTGAVSLIFNSRTDDGPLNRAGRNRILSKCKTWPMLFSVIGHCGFVLFALGLLFVNVSTAIILYETRQLCLSLVLVLVFPFTSKHRTKRTWSLFFKKIFLIPNRFAENPMQPRSRFEERDRQAQPRFFRAIFYVPAIAGVVLVMLSHNDTSQPLLAIGAVFANPETLLGETLLGVFFVLTAAVFWILQRTCTKKMAQDLAEERRDYKIEYYKENGKMDDETSDEANDEMSYEIGDFERVMSAISFVIAGVFLCTIGWFLSEPIVSIHQLFYATMSALVYSVGAVAIESQRLYLLVADGLTKTNEEKRLGKIGIQKLRAQNIQGITEDLIQMKREHDQSRNDDERSHIMSKMQHLEASLNKLEDDYKEKEADKSYFRNLDVKAVLAMQPFQFATPLGILILLWMLTILDVSHLDYLIIGAMGITVSNLLIRNISSEYNMQKYNMATKEWELRTGLDLAHKRNRNAYQALMASLWVFGTITYFTPGFATDVPLELPVTIFILVLAFRVARLVRRTSQEEEWVIEIFQKLVFLTTKKVIKTDNVSKIALSEAIKSLLLIDRHSSTDELTITYKDMLWQLNQVHTADEISDEITDIRHLVDMLVHSRQQGSRFDEVVAISMAAFLLVLGLLFFNGSREFYSELTSILLSSVVVFLLFNILDLERDRKDETLVHYSDEIKVDISQLTGKKTRDFARAKYEEYRVNIEVGKYREIEVIWVTISLVIIVLFCLLLTGVFTPI